MLPGCIVELLVVVNVIGVVVIAVICVVVDVPMKISHRGPVCVGGH